MPIIAALLPFANEIPSISPNSHTVRLFRIRITVREKYAASATKDHINPITVVKLDQLPGDILTTSSIRLRHRTIGFPIAVRRVCVRGRRGRVRNSRRRNNARPVPLVFKFLKQGGQGMGERCFTIITISCRTHANRSESRLFASHDRRHGARRIGNLAVNVVGLNKRHVGKLFKTEKILLTASTHQLTFKNTSRGDGGNPHTVTKKQDDVLRPSTQFRFSTNTPRYARY